MLNGTVKKGEGGHDHRACCDRVESQQTDG
jgi:hypothetical protein